MIPKISTPFGYIYPFILMVGVGMLAMVLVLLSILKKASNPILEQNYILPKIAVAGIFALVSAGLFDFLAKIPLIDYAKPQGISFYGGLIGSILALYLLCKRSNMESQYSVSEWFDILTIPFVIFHIFGRFGCFLGGCCYGKPTDSIFGLHFPNIPEQNVFHNGEKCYPTQLFEIVLLLIIVCILHHSQSKFQRYMVMYASGRFIIEFFRGDNRGAFFGCFSPAQWISIFILLSVCTIIIYRKCKCHFQPCIK